MADIQDLQVYVYAESSGEMPQIRMLGKISESSMAPYILDGVGQSGCRLLRPYCSYDDINGYFYLYDQDEFSSLNSQGSGSCAPRYRFSCELQRTSVQMSMICSETQSSTTSEGSVIQYRYRMLGLAQLPYIGVSQGASLDPIRVALYAINEKTIMPQDVQAIGTFQTALFYQGQYIAYTSQDAGAADTSYTSYLQSQLGSQYDRWIIGPRSGAATRPGILRPAYPYAYTTSEGSRATATPFSPLQDSGHLRDPYGIYGPLVYITGNVVTSISQQQTSTTPFVLQLRCNTYIGGNSSNYDYDILDLETVWRYYHQLYTLVNSSSITTMSKLSQVVSSATKELTWVPGCSTTDCSPISGMSFSSHIDLSGSNYVALISECTPSQDGPQCPPKLREGHTDSTNIAISATFRDAAQLISSVAAPSSEQVIRDLQVLRPCMRICTEYYSLQQLPAFTPYVVVQHVPAQLQPVSNSVESVISAVQTGALYAVYQSSDDDPEFSRSSEYLGSYTAAAVMSYTIHADVISIDKVTADIKVPSISSDSGSTASVVIVGKQCSVTLQGIAANSSNSAAIQSTMQSQHGWLVPVCSCSSQSSQTSACTTIAQQFNPFFGSQPSCGQIKSLQDFGGIPGYILKYGVELNTQSSSASFTLGCSLYILKAGGAPTLSAVPSYTSSGSCDAWIEPYSLNHNSQCDESYPRFAAVYIQDMQEGQR